MKSAQLYFILSLTSATCFANFNEPSRNIKSWENLDTSILDETIQRAHKKGMKWSVKPELYIFHLFELSELKTISYKYSADTIEAPKNIDINLVRDGFLDDSVRGDIHHLKLKKNKNGTWKVISIKKATSCWRKKELIYSSEACP